MLMPRAAGEFIFKRSKDVTYNEEKMNELAEKVRLWPAVVCERLIGIGWNTCFNFADLEIQLAVSWLTSICVDCKLSLGAF